MKIYKVYIHTFPNGKHYVGITSSSTLHRWGDRGQGYMNQKIMWRAIQKYGWDNITHTIVADNLTRKQACEMEIQLISVLQSNKRNKGYNISEGGDIPAPRSPETQAKITNKLRGRVLSEETRRKISESHKGSRNAFYGKKHSQETIEKLRLAHTGKKASESTRKKLSEQRIGKLKSQEHKDKLSKSLLGHPVSEETRLKMSVAKRGRKLSDETRRRMSEAHKRQKQHQE